MVASLSHGCFEKVEEIIKKFVEGKLSLANSRTAVRATSFTFLEKKSEEERFMALSAVAEGTKTFRDMRKEQQESREKRKLEEGIPDLRKPTIKIAKVQEVTRCQIRLHIV